MNLPLGKKSALIIFLGSIGMLCLVVEINYRFPFGFQFQFKFIDNYVGNLASSTFGAKISQIDCSSEQDGQGIIVIGEEARSLLSEVELLNRLENCQDYFKSLRFQKGLSGKSSVFDDNPAYIHEENFPLAFGISVYHQVSILEIMLLLMFRPTDTYCVHMDARVSKPVKLAVSRLIECYQEQFPRANIFLAPDNINVEWGGISVLEADMICLKHLLNKNKNWKMFLNPAATELPILSIDEIRNVLKQFPNRSVIDSFPMPRGNRHRLRKQTPPFNLTIRKGSKNVALARSFAEYVLFDEIAQGFYKWLKKMYIPDEHFYSTLATIKSVTKTNGTVKVSQDLVTDTTYGQCIRYSNWYGKRCSGTVVRGICNFGVGDIESLTNRTSKNCLMANKFNVEAQPLAILCMAKHHLTGQ